MKSRVIEQNAVPSININRNEGIRLLINDDPNRVITFNPKDVVFAQKYYSLIDFFIEKQKEFEKKKRKFLQEVKMSKEEPTKKQLYYYDKLCKRYNIEKKNVEDLSKLEIRDEIERILNEHSETDTEFN